MPELALYNEGTAVAVVLKVSGRMISRLDRRQVNLTWYANLATDWVPPGSAVARWRAAYYLAYKV